MAENNNEGASQSFIIRCEDGDDVVNEARAAKVFASSDYFRNVFRHGTTESENRVLTKPDWSRKVARKVVNLLCGGTLKERIGSPDCRKFFAAVDQIQAPISFVDQESVALATSDAQSMIEILSSTTRQIAKPLKCKMDMAKWRSLVAQGILASYSALGTGRTDISVGLQESVSLSTCPKPGDVCWYRFYSKHNVEETVIRMFDVFSRNCKCAPKETNETTLSIKFEDIDKVKDLVDIERLANKKAKSPVVRFNGGFKGLYDNVMCLFREDLMQLSSLTVKHPDSATLKRLMESSRFCQVGMFGIDLQACSVFLKKPPREMKIILENLLGKREVDVFCGSAHDLD